MAQQSKSGIEEVHILWISEGMSCDGGSVAMTAGTLPSLDEIRAGRTQTFADFRVPEEGLGVGFHEAVRGVLSHHLVIHDGKIATYHP